MREQLNHMLLTATAIIIVGAFSCCCSGKNTAVVKKEFKNYVQKTFDDPKSLKEIVEIIPHDTLSIEKMVSICSFTDSLISVNNELRSIQDSIRMAETENLANKLKRSFNGSIIEAFQGQMIVSEMMTLINNEINLKKDLLANQILLQDYRDSLSYHPALYVYKISYRNQTPDGLKLESAFAYVDSLSGFKKILPKQDDSEMICEEYGRVVSVSQKCYSINEEINENQKKQDENAAELRDFILQHTN